MSTRVEYWYSELVQLLVQYSSTEYSTFSTVVFEQLLTRIRSPAADRPSVLPSAVLCLSVTHNLMQHVKSTLWFSYGFHQNLWIEASVLYMSGFSVPSIFAFPWTPIDNTNFRKNQHELQSTMAEGIDTGEHPYVSQQGVMVPSVAFRERLDVSRMGVMPTNAAVDTPQVAAAADQDSVVDATQKDDNGNEVVMADNSQEVARTDIEDDAAARCLETVHGRVLFADSQDSVAATATEESQQPKPRKQRYKFSKKKVLANSDLFLNPEIECSVEAIVDGSVLIPGTIDECPCLKNGRMFLMKWSSQLPHGLNPDMLRSRIPASDITKELLQSAM